MPQVRVFPAQNTTSQVMQIIDQSIPLLGRLLGKHCGNSLPTSMDTGDSFAYVRFVSDGSGNAAGFSLSFEASVEGKSYFFLKVSGWGGGLLWFHE